MICDSNKFHSNDNNIYNNDIDLIISHLHMI